MNVPAIAARTVLRMLSFASPSVTRLLAVLAAVAIPVAAVVTVVHLAGADRSDVAAAPSRKPAAVTPAAPRPQPAGAGVTPATAGPGTPSSPVSRPADPAVAAVVPRPARAAAPAAPGTPHPDRTPTPVVDEPPAAPAFTPAAAQTLAGSEVDRLAAQGLLPGHASAAAFTRAGHAFATAAGVTRADVATALTDSLQRQRPGASAGGAFTAADVRSWADTQVDTAQHLGVLTAAGGRFTTATGISRADTSQLFSVVLAGRLTTAESAPTPAPFSDEAAAGSAEVAITRLAAAGIVQDGDTFNPAAALSRQQFAVILVQALGLTDAGGAPGARFSDVAVNTYADTLLQAAERAGLLLPAGTNTFRPADISSQQTWTTLMMRQLLLTNAYLTGPGGGAPPIYTEPVDVPPVDPGPGTDPGTDPGSDPVVVPAPPLPLDLSEIDAQAFARDAIAGLVASGALADAGDGTYDPRAAISRQDFATVLARALQLQAPAGGSFSEVDVTAWSLSAVDAAIRAGLLTGTGGDGSGVFDPTAPATGGQLADLFTGILTPKVIPPDPAPPVRDPLPPIVPFDPTGPAVTP